MRYRNPYINDLKLENIINQELVSECLRTRNSIDEGFGYNMLHSMANLFRSKDEQQRHQMDLLQYDFNDPDTNKSSQATTVNINEVFGIKGITTKMVFDKFLQNNGTSLQAGVKVEKKAIQQTAYLNDQQIAQAINSGMQNGNYNENNITDFESFTKQWQNYANAYATNLINKFIENKMNDTAFINSMKKGNQLNSSIVDANGNPIYGKPTKATALSFFLKQNKDSFQFSNIQIQQYTQNDNNADKISAVYTGSMTDTNLNNMYKQYYNLSLFQRIRLAFGSNPDSSRVRRGGGEVKGGGASSISPARWVVTTKALGCLGSVVGLALVVGALSIFGGKDGNSPLDVGTSFGQSIETNQEAAQSLEQANKPSGAYAPIGGGETSNSPVSAQEAIDATSSHNSSAANDSLTINGDAEYIIDGQQYTGKNAVETYLSNYAMRCSRKMDFLGKTVTVTRIPGSNSNCQGFENVEMQLPKLCQMIGDNPATFIDGLNENKMRRYNKQLNEGWLSDHAGKFAKAAALGSMLNFGNISAKELSPNIADKIQQIELLMQQGKTDEAWAQFKQCEGEEVTYSDSRALTKLGDKISKARRKGYSSARDVYASLYSRYKECKANNDAQGLYALYKDIEKAYENKNIPSEKLDNLAIKVQFDMDAILRTQRLHDWGSQWQQSNPDGGTAYK